MSVHRSVAGRGGRVRGGAVRWRQVLSVVLLASVGVTGVCASRSAWSSSIVDTAAYVPAGPARLADTRTGEGFERLDGRTIRVAVTGRAGVPGDASAAVLTVTVTDTTAGGFVSVWPAGRARPTVSVVNSDGPGQTVANTVTVQVGATGSVDVYTSTMASLVVDVVGAYVPTLRSAAGRFIPVSPRRLTDTREWRTPLTAGERLTVPVGAGVPADATAVAVNLTVDRAVAPGFWSAVPTGVPLPLASVLNTDAPGETRAALTIVPLAGRTTIDLFSQTGGHVVVDLVGWFTGPSASVTAEGLLVPIAPHRLIDTRADATPLGPGGTLRASVPRRVLALVGNLTATDSLGAGYLSAYPAGATVVRTSSLNFAANQTVANQVIAATDGGLVVEVAGSPTQIVLDITGYYVNAPDPAPLDEPTATASGRFTPTVTDVTLTSVPPDVLLPTGRATLASRTNPINGGRGGAHPLTGSPTCTVDRDAPRQCLAITLDALGFNVAGGGSVDRERRLHRAVAVLQLDAGFPETGMADRALYEYLGIWPGSATVGADEVRTIGTSQQGRTIVALRYGHGPKVTMAVGVTHGDEEAGLRVLLWAARQQRPADTTLWFVPMANPDGIALDQRFLANGTDPNRAAPSQPEQQAVLALAVAVHPTTVLYYHQNYGWIGGSGASMAPAQTYQATAAIGALHHSGDCHTNGFMWCPIEQQTGSSSVLIELPDIVTSNTVHDHGRALLAVSAL